MRSRAAQVALLRGRGGRRRQLHEPAAGVAPVQELSAVAEEARSGERPGGSGWYIGQRQIRGQLVQRGDHPLNLLDRRVGEIGHAENATPVMRTAPGTSMYRSALTCCRERWSRS